jgi:hypothetical protein
MNVSPDQVRAATRSAAAVIKPNTVPPLRLPRSAARRVLARRPRTAWFVPLAAAAAVVLVVAGGTAAGSWLSKSGNGQPSAAVAGRGTAAGPVTISGPVPPYYVALQHSSYASVRATATGAVLAKIKTRIPFVGVAGAANDRVFVLDAQNSIVGSSVTWVGQPALYLLRLSAAGREQSVTKITFPALPAGATVTGLALTADGGELAVEANANWNTASPLQEIMISNLATGKVRTWSATGSYDSQDPFGFTGSGVYGSQSISWTADGKTLAYDWQNQSRRVGVRLLDTATGGGSLTADSRLAVSLPFFPVPSPTPPDLVSGCASDWIITPDGSSIVCEYSTGIGSGSHKVPETTMGFVLYSTKTGKIARVTGLFTFKGQAPIGINLWWVGPDAKALIARVGARGEVGIVSGETFKPLPGVSGLVAAAW